MKTYSVSDSGKGDSDKYKVEIRKRHFKEVFYTQAGNGKEESECNPRNYFHLGFRGLVFDAVSVPGGDCGREDEEKYPYFEEYGI